MALQPKRQISQNELRTCLALLLLAIGFLAALAKFFPRVLPVIKPLVIVRSILSGADVSKDSSNSGMPPSTDIARKKRGNEVREKTERPVGGQKGHKGATHPFESNVTETVDVSVGVEQYENNLLYRELPPERRQVLDIKVERVVIEYRSRVFVNVKTGKKVRFEFPEGVNAPVQYGDGIEAMVLTLRDNQHIAVERLADHINSLTGFGMSPSTVVNIVKKAESSLVLDKYVEVARNDLSESPRNNADGSKISVDGKTGWMHGLVNDFCALITFSWKRGKEGIDASGVLQNFKGYLVHDFWAAYFMYTACIHCMCLAHILRELKACVQKGSAWAEDMRGLLKEINQDVKDSCGVISLAAQDIYRERYRAILRRGHAEIGWQVPLRLPGERAGPGRVARPKALNLLERLDNYEDAVLRFMTDPLISPTNNDAERIIRGPKVRLKISGCVKTEEMARRFCRTYGYFLTCKKHGITHYEAARMLVAGKVPAFIEERLAN